MDLSKGNGIGVRCGVAVDSEQSVADKTIVGLAVSLHGGVWVFGRANPRGRTGAFNYSQTEIWMLKSTYFGKEGCCGGHDGSE